MHDVERDPYLHLEAAGLALVFLVVLEATTSYGKNMCRHMDRICMFAWDVHMSSHGMDVHVHMRCMVPSPLGRDLGPYNRTIARPVVLNRTN